MKVCFETFGCRLNKAEALQMEADFLARGWQTTEQHGDADMVVVRGCSVTSRAQRDCEKLVEHLREKYPNKRLVVTGCLKDKRNEHWLRDLGEGRRAKGEGRRAERETCTVKGEGLWPSSPRLLFAAEEKSRRVHNLSPFTFHPSQNLPTRTARAYLKVQDGCSCNCAFCIVPQFRGEAVSNDFDAVLDTAKRFYDAGYGEIVVTGCNLSSYRSHGRGLADLSAALAALDPTRRIRLSSVEPGPAARELVDAMAEHANICNFLHLAIQSGSNSVLAAMRRPYSVKTVADIASAAVTRIPRLALGCDLMTGFPGETDLDFLATKLLFRRFPIAKAHVFPYSERPGTVAATLPNALPRELRRDRARELAAMADLERAKFAKKFIGRVVEIVVEDEKNLAGWTAEYLWCSTKHDPTVRFREKRKDLFRIKVLQTDGHALIGVPAT